MKTNYYLKLIVITLLLSPIISYSQGVAINTDGSSANASSMLDVKSTEKGMLIPRMTEVQRDNISNPAEGLMVYQQDGTKGFYYFEGSQWTSVSGTQNDQLETWQTPSLLNGVTNYSTGYNSIGFYKDRNRVYLKGLAGNVGYNVTLFVLPEGYRPPKSTIFYTIGNDSGRRLQIDPNGNVTLLYNSAGWLSLEGINFRID